jgi:hypothetical protein
MKKNTLVTIGLLGAAYLLFISYKKKTSVIGSVYVGQTNAPTGTDQVYSKVGTKIYDQNDNVIYTYDTANLGMTVTGTKGSKLNVIIGSDFAAGVSGFVNASDVQTI